MTPKRKAEKLVKKFSHYTLGSVGSDLERHNAKECALIVVDEIDGAIDFDWMEVQNLDRQHAYWQQVRDEINNL